MLSRSVLYLLLSTLLMEYVAVYFSKSGGYANIIFTVNLSSLVSADQQPDTDGVECEAEVGFLVCPFVQSEMPYWKCNEKVVALQLWV